MQLTWILSLSYFLFWQVESKVMVDGFIERVIFPNLTEKSYVDYSKLKVLRMRGKNLVKGTVNVMHDATNEMEFECFIYKFQGNEYRLTPFKVKRSKYCDAVMSEPYIVPKAFAGFNVPYECPIKAGNYTGNFEPDFSGTPANFDGKYKFVVNQYLPNGHEEQYIGYGELHHYVV